VKESHVCARTGFEVSDRNAAVTIFARETVERWRRSTCICIARSMLLSCRARLWLHPWLVLLSSHSSVQHHMAAASHSTSLSQRVSCLGIILGSPAFYLRIAFQRSDFVVRFALSMVVTLSLATAASSRCAVTRGSGRASPGLAVGLVGWWGSAGCHADRASSWHQVLPSLLVALQARRPNRPRPQRNHFRFPAPGLSLHPFRKAAKKDIKPIILQIISCHYSPQFLSKGPTAVVVGPGSCDPQFRLPIPRKGYPRGLHAVSLRGTVQSEAPASGYAPTS
jgi:hypothetical protein